MLGYAIKRILLVIPTVFLILIFSFFLQSLTPGDTVADMLRIDGHSLHSSRQSYDRAYVRLQKQMDLDQPTFYFSVRPSYFTDTLYKVVPKQKRVLLTTLTRQTKNWEAVSDFHFTHKRAIDLEESNVEPRSDILAVLNKISSSRDLSDVHKYLGELEKLSEEKKSKVLDSLTKSMTLLVPSQEFSWPVVSWHGLSNQFHSWMVRIFSSRNISSIDGKPTISKIKEALQWTVSMGLISLVLVGLLSLIIAYYQVIFNGGWMDRILSALLYIMIAIPTFWFATLMVVFFTTPEYGSWTNLFPSIGIKPSFVQESFFVRFVKNAGQLFLPILCLTVLSTSYLAILTKSDIIEELAKPYVTSAKAKGLSFKKLLRSHVLPNSLIPYITILTGAIPFIFTGSVIIEVIFNIPGVGRLLLYSVQHEDWPVVYTIVVLISVITILGYLIGDLLLGKLYPKTIKSLID